MRILITGNNMTYMSGQQLYCYTLAMELSKRHQVSLVSNFTSGYGMTDSGKDIMRRNLDISGVKCLNFAEFTSGSYDMAFLSETVSEQVIDRIHCEKIINIVHSTYDCETPILHTSISRYVAVRPSIKDHLVAKYSIQPGQVTIIGNGIDRHKFDPKKRRPANRSYRRIIIPCTIDPLREKFLNHAIHQANKHQRVDIYGMYCGAKIGRWKQLLSNSWYKRIPLHVGLGKYVRIMEPIWNIEDAMADADEVWGVHLGRVNLEANSMGIPSRIFDPISLNHGGFLLCDSEFDAKYNITCVANALTSL